MVAVMPDAVKVNIPVNSPNSPSDSAFASAP